MNKDVVTYFKRPCYMYKILNFNNIIVQSTSEVKFICNYLMFNHTILKYKRGRCLFVCACLYVTNDCLTTEPYWFVLLSNIPIHHGKVFLYLFKEGYLYPFKILVI